MTRGVGVGRGLHVTLATPSTWPLALAAFLIRGGILVLVVPIIVIPTPVGLGNVFGPTLTAIALGQVPVDAAVGGSLLAVTIVAWLVGGGWLAAALEAEAARSVVAEQEAGDGGPRRNADSGRDVASRGRRVAGRILAARLVAAIPFALVLVWASFRLVVTTYNELTSPGDTATPIVLRVLAARPEVVVGIVLTWMAWEIVGAIAARRIVLADDGAGRSLVAAAGECLRHPFSVLVRFWIPTLALAAVIVPSALASAAVWSATGDALDDGDSVRIVVSVVALVVLFAVGLLLVSVVCAWRAAIWTIAEAARQRTFGASADSRSGDWHGEGSSATL
ncbi:MAG: hypothetical protein ACJ77U_04865 [Chloroflexota bacterium]